MKAALIVLVVLAVSLPSLADVFHMGPGLTSLETVLVGDPGNAGEMSGQATIPWGAGPSRICGAVDHSYRVSKYEVTVAQYAEFLNYKAKYDSYGLWSQDMRTYCGVDRTGTQLNYVYTVAAGYENKPIGCVSYWDACRFVNWLNHNQGNGNTENGGYLLAGYNGTDGRTIQRTAGAKWFLPSEDEWYKAAYYKGGGNNSGYWDFPTATDSMPSNDVVNPDPGNNANFYEGGYDPNRQTTIVGEFENSESPYGTFDQAGNVAEWNESLISTANRGIRGGHLYNIYTCLMASDRPAGTAPTFEDPAIGFRIAGLVPEPSSLLALGSGILALAAFIRRRR